MTEKSQIPAVIELNGKMYMHNADGHLVPLELVREERKLEDQMVRSILTYAEELSGQIARFKAHTYDDCMAFLAVLADKYGVSNRAGKKGNVTFSSFDGLMKVEVRIAEALTFGPELQTAKELIDECINEWAADAAAPIRMLVNKAFDVDQAGKINRNAILSLRSTTEIKDPRWILAMEAITASLRVTGTKTQFYFSRRASVDDAWSSITIDLADAKTPRQSETQAA